MNRHLIFLFSFFSLLTIFSCSQRNKHALTDDLDSNWTDSLQGVYFQYGICIDSLDVTEYPIRNGDNMALIFSRLGFTPRQSDSITRACSEVLDPTKLRAGMHYSVFSTLDTLQTVTHIAFAKSLTDFAVIDLTGDEINAYEYSKPITYQRHYAEGTLNASLWNTLQREGTDPFLAVKMADVYAWQIDFYDVKPGDSFQVLYDVAYIDDTTSLGVATIEGVIFNHRGKEFVGIPFTQDSVFEYFDEEGNSLRKAFLKAPLDFVRVTSRFSNARLHPVLKVYRAHHGVDYAAPTGTPVKSIGAGTVVEKGYQANGGGNYLKVKHNSVYTTTYMHLSRFATGIQKGSAVQQGEVIGYVGSTGLSTGPHLDFRVHKNGQPINPLEMEAPPSLPVKPELVDTFAIVKQRVLAEIDSFSIIHRQEKLSLDYYLASSDEKEKEEQTGGL
ncbi:M23 family metallopeptidase [Parabacteroides sp. OttesenSCG-928-G21]|nr:M23 family metallopeptidase [Parabacteroides sp. OttesenSCG-928-G21]